MVLGLYTEVFEYRVRPESLHMVLHFLAAFPQALWKQDLPSFRPVRDESGSVCHSLDESDHFHTQSEVHVPGPLAAARASSPMKKSKSSVPRFIDRCPPGPAPPVRYDGLFATAGRPDPEPPLAAAALFVAMAVGNTKDGESLPAKPRESQRRLSSKILEVHLAWKTRYRCGLTVSYTAHPHCLAASMEGNLLVHDNGRSLGSHIGVLAARHTPGFSRALCDSYGAQMLQFVGFVWVANRENRA